MSDFQTQLSSWGEELSSYHIPRWDELPDMQLYMDQVVTYIEKHLGVLSLNSEQKIITAAMINNYVKLSLMPKPEKKRYDRVHLAYLIAITILKQVLTISDIKDGILLQSKINGYRAAYDLFCQEQEVALAIVAAKAKNEPVPIPADYPKNQLAMHMATTAVSSKLLAEKILQIKSPELLEQ